MRTLGVWSFLLLAFTSPWSVVSAAARPPRSLTLSDGWRFQPDPLDVGEKQGWQTAGFDRGGWRPVIVPMAWDRYDPVMDGYEGVGWYALALPADRVVPGAWQRLRFGRANHRATVWIDGNRAGQNLTGYLPFEINATPWLKPGRPAWIVVRVENGARYDWLPGSTTVEWVQYGGLLEPVELLTTPPEHLTHASIRAIPRGGDGQASVLIEIENTAASTFTGRVRFEAGGRLVEAAARVPPGETSSVSLELILPRARLWSLETPYLYEARVHLLDAGGEIDSLTDRFGVRSIETRGRQILLNGAPLRIRGVNRYDEFPLRGPVVDEATIRADLKAVKSMGANLVRVHYPQAPAHLRIADEIGLLYMEEVPLNWWRATWHPPVPQEFDNDRIIDLAEQTLEQMVRRDGNHPALVFWSMANECQTADEPGIRAMERLLRRAKLLDPTRLATYVANRKLEQNRAFALADFVAVNLYFGMWDGSVAEDLAQIDQRVYTPTRQRLAEIAALFPDKPIVLSEFGTIGIPGSGGDMRFSEDYQAAYLSAVWRAVEAVPEISGGIVWCWADYRQRRGFTNDFPTYYGPFGIVTLERHPKKAHAVLTRLWADRAAGR
ncbi:MAG TPA: glycoside hydrolase family 2 TIM barrel-domain containing protein [Patescibacteria group bacterium]|nr:glycoside hydrolase family 2 TIM barrel-domain containing protein [Patescibacteria group bacterium]